jgi:hypothetical protein
MHRAFTLTLLLTLSVSVLLRSSASGSDHSEPTGLKLKTRHTSAGLTAEYTRYLQGDRGRLEYRSATGENKQRYGGPTVRYGPRLAMISRCDLRKNIELNLDSREYTVSSMTQFWSAEERLKYALATRLQPVAAAPDAKPTFEIQTITRDTGERRESFGHTARHVITTRKEIPFEGSRREPQESVTDGWYIDLDHTGISCDQKQSGRGGHAYLTVQASGDPLPPEKPTFVDVGEPVTGFPIETKVTYRNSAQGLRSRQQVATTAETRVVELWEGKLDDSLFEVPAGFTPVEHLNRHSETPAQPWSQFWGWVREEWDRFFR